MLRHLVMHDQRTGESREIDSNFLRGPEPRLGPIAISLTLPTSPEVASDSSVNSILYLISNDVAPALASDNTASDPPS